MGGRPVTDQKPGDRFALPSASPWIWHDGGIHGGVVALREERARHCNAGGLVGSSPGSDDAPTGKVSNVVLPLVPVTKAAADPLRSPGQSVAPQTCTLRALTPPH